jgi:hypothetical protein
MLADERENLFEIDSRKRCGIPGGKRKRVAIPKFLLASCLSIFCSRFPWNSLARCSSASLVILMLKAPVIFCFGNKMERCDLMISSIKTIYFSPLCTSLKNRDILSEGIFTIAIDSNLFNDVCVTAI